MGVDMRKEKQVEMIGHDDISKDQRFMLCAGAAQPIDDIGSIIAVCKQGQVPVTGECDKSASFSMIVVTQERHTENLQCTMTRAVSESRQGNT